MKKLKVTWGGGFCEHCGKLDLYQGQVVMRGVSWCLCCAGGEADLSSYEVIEEKRRKIFEAAMIQAQIDMDMVTPK